MIRTRTRRSYAYKESFAIYSKGGGPESNMKFVPYMVQMAVYLFMHGLTGANSSVAYLLIPAVFV